VGGVTGGSEAKSSGQPLAPSLQHGDCHLMVYFHLPRKFVFICFILFSECLKLTAHLRHF
jgi:hypothetical protein